MKAPTETPPHETRGKTAPWIGLVLVLTAFAFSLALRFEPAILDMDANGYFAQGVRIAATGKASFKPEIPVQFIWHQWVMDKNGRLFNKSPLGLPALVSVVYRLFGLKACLLINPILACLSIIGLFLLISRLTDPRHALFGAGILAVNPIFHFHALLNDSHMSVTFLLAWGLFGLVSWSRTGQASTLFFAALALGAIPAVRHAETLYALGAGTFLLLHAREPWMAPRHFAAAAAGVAIPVVPVLVRNHLAFGAFWRTPYSLSSEQTAFGLHWLQKHLGQYLEALLGHGAGLFFAFGVAGIAAMAGARNKNARFCTMAALIVFPITLLYMSYFWAPISRPEAILRFLLPTFVLYIAAGVWLLRECGRHLPKTSAILIMAAVAAVQAGWGAPKAWELTRSFDRGKKILASTDRFLKKHVPPGSVVISTARVLQHLDFVGKWKLADHQLLIAPPRPVKAPLSRPVLTQPEKRSWLASAYPGLDQSARQEAIARDLVDWADGNDIYFLVTRLELASLEKTFFRQFATLEIARLRRTDPPDLRIDEIPPHPNTQPPNRDLSAPKSPGTPNTRPGFLDREKELMLFRWPK